MRYILSTSATLVLLAFAGPSDAAAPKVSYLYPAGGTVGQTLEVNVTGKLGDGTKCWCSQPGITVDIPDKGQKIEMTIANDAKPGRCWLRFYNADGASSLRPFVIGTLREVAESESNNEITKAQKLPSSAVVINGRLNKSGDVDTFAVEMKKNQTLVASMEANRRLGSPMDGVLQIVSSRGFVLEQNDDHCGFDPQIAFVAESDGTYFVRAFAFPAEPNSSIRFSGAANYIYRLTVTTGAFVDHAIPMAVTRGSSTKVRLSGWNLSGELLDYSVEAQADEQRFALIHHARLANTTRVKIEPHVTASEQQPNDPAHPQQIEVPMTVTGVIEKPHDVDVYRLRAKKGDKLVFTVESRAFGYPLDPVLRLVDPNGKTVREAETRSSTQIDEVLTQTIANDGDYELHISDLHHRGGFRFVYCLVAEYQKPDFSLSVVSDVFTLTPGKPLEIPVTIVRPNRFAAEIEIIATGLPQGVTATSVKSLPKGATSKNVKIVLDVKQRTPFSGPIRIVGKSTGENPMQRKAKAKISGLNDTTSAIWLTVLKTAPKK